MAQTYRAFAQLIRDTFYAGDPSDDAKFSERYFAELIAVEVADLATRNAYENSNAGETTYVSDSFLTTYTDLPVLFDEYLKLYYFTLPDVPPALPKNQGIQRVWPRGATKVEIMLMSNKDKGVQDLLPPIGKVIFCYEEGKRMYFYTDKAFPIPAVNLVMAGTSPSGNIMDATLNLGKNYQKLVMDTILNRLDPRRFARDIINDSVDSVATQR